MSEPDNPDAEPVRIPITDVFDLHTVPPREVRTRILSKSLGAVPHDASWLDRVVRDDRATPADLARAAKVASTLESTDAHATQACGYSLTAACHCSRSARSNRACGSRPTGQSS